MSPITNYTRAAETMCELLGHHTADVMSNSTPCADWTVAQLAQHVVDNAHFFAGAEGAPAPEAQDVTPENANALYEEAAAAVLDSYGVAQSAGSGATSLDRLAAFTGRSV